MFRNLLLIIVIFSFSSLSPVFAKTPASTHTNTKGSQALAEELIVVSGVQHTLEQIPGLIEAGFAEQQQEMGLPDDFAVVLIEILRESYNPATLGQSMVGGVSQSLSASDMNLALDWLTSPLGKRITAMESRASEPEAMQEMAVMAATPLEAQVSKNRLAQYQKLDDAVLASEVTVEMMLSIQTAMLSTLMEAMPEMREPLGEAVAMIEALKPQMIAMMEQQVLMGFAYSYKELSDEEMGKYLAFAESKVGRRYHRSIFEAFNDAFTHSSKQAGSQLALLMTAE